MQISQTIHQPVGVNVFGSALIRVEPDLASLNFAVTHLAGHPKDAFREVRAKAQEVRTYLAQAKISEVSSSHVSLAEETEYINGKSHMVGYSAKIAFNVLLRDLGRVEELLAAIVDAGVNRISSVEFQTSRLREVRAEARRRAVEAAHYKAALYCEAGKVRLGEVLHIEDVNPDQLRGYEGHVFHEVAPDDEGPVQAIDPGSIVVRAAVMLSYQIKL